MQILNTAATNAAQSSGIFGAKPHATSSPASSASNATSSTGTSSTDQLTNESTFLQLLVSQIQNQDPLNPTDSIQFVGQLVQFSQLEQLLSINKGVTSLVTDVTPPSSTPPASTGSTNQTSSN